MPLSFISIGRLLLTSTAAALFAVWYSFSTGQTASTYCYTSITTLSSKQPTASCFSVSKNGLFSRVYSSPATPDAIQGHVIPGLWDGHGHLLQYGELLQSANLFGSASMQEVLERLRHYIGENPETGTRDNWVRGVGWDQAVFGGVMPTAAELEADPVLKGKYLMLDRVDVHCIWVSESVLQLLPDSLPEVPGGEIITTPGKGVFCDNAMDMVLEHWPKPDINKKTRFVKSAMKELNKVGLVGMHDAGATPGNLKIFKDLANTKDWTVRVYGMFECDKRNTFCPKDAIKVSRNDGMLTVRSVKLFADGALGSWGSALIEPYSDHTWTRGSLLINASDLNDVTASWAQAGYQVNIHAIGDLANRHAVTAISEALSRLCPSSTTPRDCQSKHRFRIEHAQIIHPADQARIHDTGIIPSIQPTHATSDMYYAAIRLGQKRTNEEAYRMRSLLPVQPVLGSDFPVEPPNPFEGIFAAVTRLSPHTGLDPAGTTKGWHKEEALTLTQALEGFTLNPARGAFLEDRAGKIEEGMWADWVVLDKPLEDMSMEELLRVNVKETWVGGKLVFSRN